MRSASASPNRRVRCRRRRREREGAKSVQLDWTLCFRPFKNKVSYRTLELESYCPTRLSYRAYRAYRVYRTYRAYRTYRTYRTYLLGKVKHTKLSRPTPHSIDAS